MLKMLAAAAAKRAAPRPVTSVVLDRARYEVPPWSRAAGEGQDGGVVLARDAVTGAERPELAATPDS